jgi:hypoxanthine-guanine phosphoribosyltransferase
MVSPSKLVAIRQQSIFNFPNLVSSPYDLELYLGYYFKQGKGEEIHDKLINFKERGATEFRQWSGLMLEQLNKIKMANILPQVDVMLRCLGSSETSFTEGTPLTKLLYSISGFYGSVVCKDLIYKTRITKKLAFMPTLKERQKEVEETFRIDCNVIDLNNKVVLVLDDIRTSGTTTNYIAKLIRECFEPKLLILVTLGHTDNRTPENENINKQLVTHLARF